MRTYRTRLLSPWARDILAGVGIVAFVVVTFWSMGRVADLIAYMQGVSP